MTREKHSQCSHRFAPGLFFKRRAVSIGIILGLLTAVVVVLYLYNNETNKEINDRNTALQLLTAKADAELQQIAERKAAEEEAHRIAAAHDVAEKAKDANAATAGTVDSKLCNTSTTHNNPALIDVLVNKKHCIQPVTFEPNDLVTSNGATLSAKAINDFNRMMNDALAMGQGFYVTSSYRSYATQVSTYNYWVSISGKEAADTYSARPGYSEHQTGLVIDVAANGCALDCFGTTSQYQWLLKNAAEYGFIQRYYAGSEAITGYKAEEWHYRYVGKKVAKDMQLKGIKTLEEYWNVPGGDY